jgi:predicted DNA-binding helix-hairpin-helix protein
MRYYRFQAHELTSESQPNLSLTKDPKQEWAERNDGFFPLDVNQAPREALLRVPGIGYRDVEKILKIRRYHRLSLDDLRKLKARVGLANPYVITSDHLPFRSAAEDIRGQDGTALQLDLFAPQPGAALAAISGEM